VTEGRKRIATNAYSLVTQWKLPPGSLPDGTFSGEALRSWLQAVDAECTRSGHREVAMTMAGHALAYAPPDPGGLWIHSSVAHVLDAEGADLLREGFRTELFNSRGAHWVDPSGAPERELAAGYHSKADALDLAGHHRLAAQLRGLASEYEREALRVSSPDPSDL
jgi:hypothetical protein